jgi:hypothetical protein
MSRYARAIGAIVFIVLAYTVLTLATEYLPLKYRGVITFLWALIALVAVAWAFVSDHEGRR